MNVNFNEKERTFKTLGGVTIRNTRLDILIIIKASEIAKTPIYDVKRAALILEGSGVSVSSLFDGTIKPLTLKTICIEALDAPTPQGEKKLTAEQRYYKGDLIRKIYGAKGSLDLEAKDIATIKELLAESNYLNSVIYQAYDWLEGKAKKEK